MGWVFHFYVMRQEKDLILISQKHGGKIIEKKKEQTVDMKQLQFIASLQLVESALQVCPDNVPEKIEKQFKIETERLKKLQGL